ncbi:MAG: acyl-[acyl-carrier-protein]--UDP-N-acetylglucosamine O-acyltransferase [Hyphomicrobiales bacterium]|nr:MAG: acyl-[acyl-carrier-protein]--UDP-N-acetylglucosamine O-acyltransferase [Hyphomicrobiales bacterium]
MTTNIHPTAIIEEGAEIADGASIGPYSVIGPKVRIGTGAKVHAHVVIDGNTEIGSEVTIYPFASIGLPPQDLKFRGEDTRLVVGAGTTIREHVTMNPGTAGGGAETRVGENCLIMVGAHVAHDCVIGNHVILVNNATLAGHVHIGDFAILGGLCAVHQWVRVGSHAFVGGMSGVENDVIPFGSVIGNRAHLGGLNIVGLKRHGVARDTIHALRKAYRMLFADEGTLKERVDDVARTFGDEPEVQRVIDFIRDGKDRALCTPRSTREDA